MKPKHVFRARAGYTLSQKKVDRLGPFIERFSREGRDVPKELLEAARPRGSPIHKDFEWDDRLAAERWRLKEATYYVRAISYEVVYLDAERNKQSTQMRVSYNYKDDDGRRVYTSGANVVTDSFAMTKLIEQALDGIESWRCIYAALRKSAELSGLFGVIEEILEKRKKARSAA